MASTTSSSPPSPPSSSSSSSSPPTTTSTCLPLLLCCLLWASLTVSVSVSAMPSDARESMRAGIGSLEPAAAEGGALADNSDVEIYDSERHLVEATRKPYNCSRSHRAHGNDTNKFQIKHNNVWWDQVCQTGLVWNQTLCRCDYQQDSEVPPACTDYRPHRQLSGKYQQQVNGVWLTRDCNLAVAGLLWNQTACRCVWGPEGDTDSLAFERSTPCETMLNVTFEKGLVDDAKSSFLQLTSGSVLALRHYRTAGEELNVAAYFQSAVMTVWYFAGNEMSSSLRVGFRFKPEDSSLTRDSYQILMSNGCNVTGSSRGFISPTLAIGYRAADRSFLLALHTANTQKAIVCTRDLDPYAWHQVFLIYEDGTLLFRVDNFPCIISSDFSGPVQKTSCPLTIGADPLERESKYIGYMDDLVVARHCRRFVEQTLVVGGEGEEDEDVLEQLERTEGTVNADGTTHQVEINDDDNDNDNVPPQSSYAAHVFDVDKDKPAPRGDTSALHSDSSVKREGDKSPVREGDSPARMADDSARQDDNSTERDDKSAERDAESDRRSDKSAPRDAKSVRRDDESPPPLHAHAPVGHENKSADSDEKPTSGQDDTTRRDSRFTLSPGPYY